MSLQIQLDNYKAESRRFQNPQTSALIQQSIDDLRARLHQRTIPQVGQAFPDFVLPDSRGGEFSLAHAIAQGPLVITFYRGLWCPYCNIELEALAQIHDQLRSLGARLVAVSPQTAANSKRAIRQKNIPFPVLVDKGNELAAAAGLRYRLQDYLIEVYSVLGVNLPLINGDNSWTLPIPSRFVVDGNGVVRSASADPDYTRRPEPSDTLALVESLCAGKVSLHDALTL